MQDLPYRLFVILFPSKGHPLISIFRRLHVISRFRIPFLLLSQSVLGGTPSLIFILYSCPMGGVPRQGDPTHWARVYGRRKWEMRWSSFILDEGKIKWILDFIVCRYFQDSVRSPFNLHHPPLAFLHEYSTGRNSPEVQPNPSTPPHSGSTGSLRQLVFLGFLIRPSPVPVQRPSAKP